VQKLFSICLSFFIFGCAPPTDDAGELRLGTASLGGAYYPLGQSMANLVNKYANGTRMVPVVTAGSPQNPRLLISGDIEAGLTNADLAYFAYQGLPPYQDPLAIRSMGVLHPSILHLVTLADSDLENFEDIRGKRVAVGPASGGTVAYLELLLDAYGMTMDDFNPSYLSYSDGFSQLADGNVDASFALIGMPGAAISQLRVSHRIRFLEVNPSMLEKILIQHEYYQAIDVHRDLYDTDENTIALGVNNLLIVREDLPELTAYDLTAAIFNHLDEFAKTNVNAEQIDIQAYEQSSIPLHPGSKRFFAGLGERDTN
jgi:TRAP transporter TAXI family solute receptor